MNKNILIISNTKEICIDFDGTLAIDNYPNTISKDLIEENVGILKDLKEKGYKITIFTARNKTDRNKVKKILNENDIPYDKITNVKPSTGSVFLDDRAINVPYNGKWGKGIIKKIDNVIKKHEKVKSFAKKIFEITAQISSFDEATVKNKRGSVYNKTQKSSRGKIDANMMSTEVYDNSESNNTQEEQYFHWNLDNVLEYIKPKKTNKKKRKKIKKLESKSTKEKIKELLKDDVFIDEITEIKKSGKGDGTKKEKVPFKRQYIGETNKILKDKPKRDKSNSLNYEISDDLVKNFISHW